MWNFHVQYLTLQEDVQVVLTMSKMTINYSNLLHTGSEKLDFYLRFSEIY